MAGGLTTLGTVNIPSGGIAVAGGNAVRTPNNIRVTPPKPVTTRSGTNTTGSIRIRAGGGDTASTQGGVRVR